VHLGDGHLGAAGGEVLDVNEKHRHVPRYPSLQHLGGRETVTPKTSLIQATPTLTLALAPGKTLISIRAHSRCCINIVP
jgi:hypothetical protein